MSTGTSRSAASSLSRLEREYQEFPQEPNRNCPDSDGRPGRDEDAIRDWLREQDLPYFDGLSRVA
jgi:hypothetical protein